MNLSSIIGGISLRNRSVLASGILGVTMPSLKRIYEEGAGLVTSKSIGLKPRKGHRGPVIFDYDYGLINAVGLPNPGVNCFIEQNKNYQINFPLIISIFGEKIEDYPLLADNLKEVSHDFIEINISCPNVEDEFGRPFSYSKDLTYKITKSVKDATDKPVIVKLSPNTPEIVDIALQAQDGGADVINVINTVGPGMVINVNTGYPILSNLKGGISGDAVLPLTVRYVYELYKELSIPVIGTGGISDSESALQVLMAGAHLFSVGTAVYTKGISVFKDIERGIHRFMDVNKIDDLDEIIGISHRLKEKSSFYFSFDRYSDELYSNGKRHLSIKPKFIVNGIKEIIDDKKRHVRQLFLIHRGEVRPLPGQFYMVWLPGIDYKPFSVLYYKSETIGFAIAKRGKSTQEIFNLDRGHPLGILGPLGKGFDLTRESYILLAGGIGLAPLLFAADTLISRGKKVTLVYGGKSEEDIDWFKEFIDRKAADDFQKITTYYITEDGSIGRKGLITDYIVEISDEVNPDFALVCGPELFIKKSAEICLSIGINGEASIERMMKCGIGLCGSCTLDDDGTRVCKDGPVFSFNRIMEFKEFGNYKRDESGRIVDI